MKEIKIVPEQLFFDDIRKLINNLLINNPNFKNGHYYKQGHFDSFQFMEDQKERATYIFERMEQEKHLINL